MTHIGEYVRYIPRRFDTPPTTVVEALRYGREVLVEEETRWRQAEWFTNAHPEVNPEDPFCNSWAVCAEGAVGVCTLGTRKTDPIIGDDPWMLGSNELAMRRVASETGQDPDYGLYDAAVKWLTAAANEILSDRLIPACGDNLCDGCSWCQDQATGEREYMGHAGVVDYANEFNDDWCKTRTEAIEWFDVAIELASADAT